MKKFTESHEWIQIDDTIGTVGITDYAQKELGDIVYVELPEVGKSVSSGGEAAVLESTKAAADIYSPVSGEIIAVNESLKNASEQINHSPETEGWIFKIKMSHQAECENLMDTAQYEAYIHKT